MTTTDAAGTPTLIRSHTEITDPATANQYLGDAYGACLQLSSQSWSSSKGVLLSHTRVSVGPLTIDDIYVAGYLEARADAPNKVVAVWPTGGRVSSACEGFECRAAKDDVALLSQPYLPFVARSEDLRATAVVLNPSPVVGLANGMSFGEVEGPIRFFRLTPVGAAAARLWKNTVVYVKDNVLADDALATPLVLGHVTRLLAAVTLSTFPNSARVPRSCSHDHTDHQPVLLRRAIEFIDANVQRGIGLTDIAEAVHVTPRAVQYMFRRHRATTPLQYLRRARLNYAHRELLAGRQGATVTEIAARWGFAHTGRFAVLYRQTYGQSPHITLNSSSSRRHVLRSDHRPHRLA
ncbi:hypothetical protein A5759_17035 [Mycobacterium sp. 852014-52144_SCH5372336]|nr:hypothetical protein A5759_17035 [Mycobacterium sp. 852014-52144_SCH5372336]